ncbi:MAG TPA: methionine--tRNA ligase [Candidatus Paceibacterota bacterium]|nr:methionine--tRNA ligase [Candidatus Paceibacterota bacterium]
MKKVFVSTSIPYVNASPHLGHALELVQADVIARHHRLLGDRVFFLSGTDENSLKNVRSAENAGENVADFVYKNYLNFYNLKEVLNISFDDFIRTTEKRHFDGAQKLWMACKKDIYKKKYSGLYCVGCEEYYKEDDLINGLCPEHKVAPELIEEENYFFKLSNYQEKIKELIEKDEVKIIPQSRKNEILSFINSGLQDFCISRTSERAKGWGIDVPGDETQKMWVWFDALSNYINALGYGSNNESKFLEFWQNNDLKIHIIGKGINRFHSVYWLAMLLSAGISLPKTLFVHGYITVDGQKMSKSLGNVINPYNLVEKYGCDAVRYFLLREIPALGDGDFTFEKFEKRYNSDLAGGIGNLLSRTLVMINKKNVIFNRNPEAIFVDKNQEVNKKIKDNFIQFNDTLSEIWELVSFCDKYIEEKKPWAIEDKDENEIVFSNIIYSLKNISQMLKPFLPDTAEKIEEQIKTLRPEPLFPRI